MEPAWSAHEHFFLTEDTALGRSIAEKHKTYFVDHVALGQARLGAPVRMLVAAARNFVQSARIILARRPNVIVSTGAGAAFSAVLWGRLVGAKVLVVESFARFERPSAFARIASRFAHEVVIQSAALSAYFPKAAVFDPMAMLDEARPAKEPLLFATVGATLPFDRLVETVTQLQREGVIPERVLIQTGIGGARPEGMEVVETLSFDEIQDTLRRADIVVSHGGTGSLITGLRAGCRVIAMPRLFERGEHYDNHQAEIATAFASRGLIEVANSPEELRTALQRTRGRDPILATSNPVGLVNHLKELLSRWAGEQT